MFHSQVVISFNFSGTDVPIEQSDMHTDLRLVHFSKYDKSGNVLHSVIDTLLREQVFMPVIFTRL